MQVGGVVRLHLVEHVGGAVVVELARGCRPARSSGISSSASASRSSGSSSATSMQALLGQVEQGVREVGGLQVGVGRDELLGGLRLAGVDLLAHLVPGRERGRRPCANGEALVLRAAQEELADLPLAEARSRSIATSSIDGLARAVARAYTLRPSSSAITRTSPPRCSKRRTLMRPVVMIWPAPMLVTRPIETKTRRLPGISTMRPTTRGGSARAVDDEDVADLADPVARGVEDGAPGQSGDEDSRGAHEYKSMPSTRWLRARMPAGECVGEWRHEHSEPLRPVAPPRRIPDAAAGRGRGDLRHLPRGAAAPSTGSPRPTSRSSSSRSSATTSRPSRRVTGKLTYGRAALAGAASGAWLGLFLGLLSSSSSPPRRPHAARCRRRAHRCRVRHAVRHRHLRA